MIVNGKEYKIEDLIENMKINESNLVGSGNYVLTKKEVDILNFMGIDYKKYNNYKDLMFVIEDIIDNEDLDEEELDSLDYVLDQISERDYYSSNK